METGTYRGTTTRYLAQQTGVSVFTIERDPRCFGFASQALRDLANVQLRPGDSVRELPPLLAVLAERRLRPFVYLDAHWGDNLPLGAELSLVFGALRRAVVAIDDFRVPDDPGYGYDDYGPGAVLDLETFSPLFADLRVIPFFPALSAQQESGMRRGVVVLAAAAEPLHILRRIPLLRELPPPWLAAKPRAGEA